MMAYLVEMTVRLVELRRTLKRAGSLYLHCDPTASQYLKLILDAIFGPMSFKNEIIWGWCESVKPAECWRCSGIGSRGPTSA